MKTIFVLSGENPDRKRWLVRAFGNAHDAGEALTRCQAYAGQMFAYWNAGQMTPWAIDGLAKQNPDDPQMTLAGGLCQYDVKVVPFGPKEEQ